MWVVKAGGKSLFQGTKGKKKITVSNSSFPSAGSVQTVASLFRGDDDSRKVSCVEVPNKLCHLEFVFGRCKSGELTRRVRGVLCAPLRPESAFVPGLLLLSDRRGPGSARAAVTARPGRSHFGRVQTKGEPRSRLPRPTRRLEPPLSRPRCHSHQRSNSRPAPSA